MTHLAFALLLAWDAYALGTRAQWANSLTCAIMAGMTIGLWWRIR